MCSLFVFHTNYVFSDTSFEILINLMRKYLSEEVKYKSNEVISQGVSIALCSSLKKRFLSIPPTKHHHLVFFTIKFNSIVENIV